jgi:hypothetical protein
MIRAAHAGGTVEGWLGCMPLHAQPVTHTDFAHPSTHQRAHKRIMVVRTVRMHMASWACINARNGTRHGDQNLCRWALG